ncbi:hypothetical protein ACPA9J_14100 [Pseudomonas aeruginosa]
MPSSPSAPPTSSRPRSPPGWRRGSALTPAAARLRVQMCDLLGLMLTLQRVGQQPGIPQPGAGDLVIGFGQAFSSAASSATGLSEVPAGPGRRPPQRHARHRPAGLPRPRLGAARRGVRAQAGAPWRLPGSDADDPGRRVRPDDAAARRHLPLLPAPRAHGAIALPTRRATEARGRALFPAAGAAMLRGPPARPSPRCTTCSPPRPPPTSPACWPACARSRRCSTPCRRGVLRQGRARPLRPGQPHPGTPLRREAHSASNCSAAAPTRSSLPASVRSMPSGDRRVLRAAARRWRTSWSCTSIPVASRAGA